MAIAPVAVGAEAPVLAELLVDLFVLLGWVVCLGLLWAWRHTIGAALRAAGSALDFKVLGVKIPLGLPLEKLDDVVTSNLGAYANATHRAVGYFWNQAAHLQTWVGDEIAGIAEDTADQGYAVVLSDLREPDLGLQTGPPLSPLLSLFGPSMPVRHPVVCCVRFVP